MSFRKLIWMILLFSCLHAQAQISGVVIDDASGEGLPFAGITVKGTFSGAVADSSGNFSIPHNQFPCILEISYIGYKKSFVMLDHPNNRLLIRLQIDDINIAGVEIYPEGVSAVLKDKEIHIFDYGFYRDHLFVIRHETESGKHVLSEISAAGKILQDIELPDEPGELFEDCIGNLHALSPDTAYQLYQSESGWGWFSDPIDTFLVGVKPCIARLEDFFYVRQYRYNNQILDLYAFSANVEGPQHITRVMNKEKMHQLQDPKGIYAQLVADPDDLEYITADISREIRSLDVEFQFQQLAFFYPVFVPVFPLKDRMLIFDHVNGKILHTEKDGSEMKSVPINYHQLPKWKREMYFDPVTESVYTLFRRNGLSYLAEIDPDTGDLLSEQQIPKEWIQKIIIRDDICYFMYRESNYDITNRLYRMPLK